MNWLIEKKDLLTNVLGFVIVAIGIVDTYMKANAGQEVNYFNLGIALVTGAVAYFTGKKTDGK